MNDISQLQFEVNLIKSDKVRKVVEDILKYKTPSYFWRVDSSSTGQYHPKDSNGSSVTLVNHTKSATRVLKLLLTHPMIGSPISQLQEDLMTGAIIIHDTVKRGFNESEYTIHEHPLFVSLLAPDNMDEESSYYFKEIVRLAVTHTGYWRRSTSSDVVLPQVETYDQYLVHLADWLSSRRIFHVEVTDDQSIFNYINSRDF